MGISQSGSNNTQHVGDINNNFLHSLKIDPKEIELKALVKINYAKLWTFLTSVFISMVIVERINQKHPDQDGTFFAILIISLVIWPTIYFCLDTFSAYLPYYNVIYNNNALTVQNVKREFYSEIWDMKYKDALFGDGASLTIYAMNAQKNIPHERKIFFKKRAAAKYIHDVFWSKDRIEKFKNGESNALESKV